ncbi:MAG: anaerobic ribonucleoside-triphosphate reductase activating protein [Candidatus Omnitrophica bacterium]|nr:anaerobic ribonucleoside-triphosphate reductase activating protein [Candidatus Omnitrophota bacterium]MCB9721994.1 anaerobic ribonucleoside-triphosphate reductase activating protein [Candidatus Omnitrophota bacterium]
MLIGGLHKLSLIDYPGKLAAVIFTRGCNFRCPYCHNPELVIPQRYAQPLSVEYVLDYLRNRRFMLDAVVVSGGEPTIHHDLPELLSRVREFPYLIKLDTNGSNPAMLERIIRQRYVDYIAMDVKTGLAGYEKLSRTRFCVGSIRRSVDLIKNSGIAHEFRTTVVKSLNTKTDMSEISQLIDGCRRYRLQPARLDATILEPALSAAEDFSPAEFAALCDRWEINTANPEITQP